MPKPPRVLIAECKQEVSAFNPRLSRYEDFAIDRCAALLAYHRGVRNEVGGALRVFGALGVTVAPALGARAITSGGALAAGCFHNLASELLDAVAGAGPADAIYLSLHCAMASEDQMDLEGYLIERTRDLAGPRTPIVVSLDLHGILTAKMLEHSDGIVAYHTYPHVDFFKTGMRAARLPLRIQRREVAPVAARVFIPALVRGDELITETGLYGRLIEQARNIENGPRGLSAAILIGNPFTDVPELGSAVLVTLDDDAEAAAGEAEQLGREFWSVRESLKARLTNLDESVRAALAARGRVVLVDAADAPNSGASGDGNAILRSLLDAGCARRALIPIVDPAAVDEAWSAGVGADIAVNPGGAIDTRRFRPVRVNARVAQLSDGHPRSESHGELWEAGRTAVLVAGTLVVIATSRPVCDRALFLAHGLEPSAFDINVVKSPDCQPHFFNEGAECAINVDAPGSSSANLPTLGHRRCRRPMYPLDASVAFEPKAEVFRRIGL